MNEFSMVQLVALAGWLVLVIAGYRSYRVGSSKTVTYVIAWAVIFTTVALLFSVLA